MIIFTVVTIKFLYTKVDLNLPHHLNYVAALPCKCTQRIVHVKPVKLRVKKFAPITFAVTLAIAVRFYFFRLVNSKYLRPSVR